MDSRRSILIAEDHPEIVNHWATALTRAGWAVTTARDGHQALEHLANGAFSLVVCDLHLGPGPTALDILRAHPDRWRETPFIVVSGLGTVSACRDALTLGARDFIEKPVSAEMFLFILENVLRTGQPPPNLPASRELPGDDTDTGTARVRIALMFLDRVLYRHDTTVAKVADAAGVSAEHLARLFRRHIGRTPLEVIHTLRIRQAEKMLPNPHLSVHDVARECGYKTQQQFANWFRWKHGVAPSEWRTANLGKG